MTQDLGFQLREDRLLRDAALALVKSDYANLRADFSGKSIGDRVAGRVHDGALDIFEEAVELADSNRGVLAVLIGAILLWFARNPIMALLIGDDEDEDYGDDAEPA